MSGPPVEPGLEPAPLPGPPAYEAPPYAPPSMLGRIVGAVVVGILSGILLVVIPQYIIGRLGGVGLVFGLSAAFIGTTGTILAALIALRYLLKITRLYGPAWALVSVASIAYLLSAASHATVSLSPGSGATVAFGFGDLLRLLVIPAGISLVAALFTTLCDLVHPTARREIDFPMKSPA